MLTKKEGLQMGIFPPTVRLLEACSIGQDDALRELLLELSIQLVTAMSRIESKRIDS